MLKIWWYVKFLEGFTMLTCE